jgi:hypothetical protein
MAGWADGSGAAVQVKSSFGVAVHLAGGRLYSSDTVSQSRPVLSTELANVITSTVAGSASIGSLDGLGTNAVFKYLESLAFSSSSSLLYAIDQNARMRWWPSQGGMSAPGWQRRVLLL